MDEAQAGITITERNINNLRYPDYTGWMASLTQWTCSKLGEEYIKADFFPLFC